MSFEIRAYTHFDRDEILPLYASVGWTAYTDRPETLENGFAHSLLTLAAYDGGRLVGLIRTVGDGSTVVWIQDLLVAPDHQRRGIGSGLIRAILERFSTVRQIMLATDCTEKTQAFYRSQGFREFSELNCCGFMKG